VIHIPNYTSSQDDSGPFVLYFIQVRQLSSSSDMYSSGWIVARRFSEFFELHRVLKSKFKDYHFDLPSRHVVSINRFKHEFLESRRIALEKYLKVIVYFYTQNVFC
jgi:sorting nexin-25